MPITQLRFVEEFPMLISASESGIITVNSVRGSNKCIRGHTIARFLITGSVDLEKIGNIGITGMAVELRNNVNYDPNEK